MWLVLCRLKEEGKEGVQFGQYLYEIYNHDLELRVSKAGINLLLIKWMKELKKIFYGNIVAYDAAMKPVARHDDLASVIWRNIFSEDGSENANAANAAIAVQTMARYTRRESTSLSLTGKQYSLKTSSLPHWETRRRTARSPQSDLKCAVENGSKHITELGEGRKQKVLYF